MENYPFILEKTHCSRIVALSDTEIGKVILPSQLRFVDMRPTHYYNRNDKEWIFQNIVQTATGLRLIDAGFAKTREKDNFRAIISVILCEQEEMKCFKEYYLS